MTKLLDVRRQFPLLQRTIGGHAIAYLDNAATTQKPECVLQAMEKFQRTSMANVHRALHPLAEEATAAYEHARSAVQSFINARRSHEVIFTKGTTEGINLLARSFGATLKVGDSIALTQLEHHSNIVPWLQLKAERGIEIHWIKTSKDGHLDTVSLEEALSRTRLKAISLTGLSNVLGTMPDLASIRTITHQRGVRMFVDAAQLAAHHPIDVQKLGIDALVFSGHKIYGPTGIGVLWAREELLETLPPFLGGGEMIQTVTQDAFTCAELPYKFEAGTPPITEAVGLATAIEWLQEIPWKQREKHEQDLLEYATEALSSIESLTLLGPRKAKERSGCISFAIPNIHPHDLTHIVGQDGVCLRGGHHCTQPLHRALGIPASARLSLALYNTRTDIDRAVESIKHAIKKFR